MNRKIDLDKNIDDNETIYLIAAFTPMNIIASIPLTFMLKIETRELH